MKRFLFKEQILSLLFGELHDKVGLLFGIKMFDYQQIKH